MVATDPNQPEYLTLSQAARTIRCNPRILRRARDSGQLEVVRLGQRWQRVHVAELARWCRLHRMLPVPSVDEQTRHWLGRTREARGGPV